MNLAFGKTYLVPAQRIAIYAFEDSGIIPNVLLLSKAISGSLPLSVVLYNQALDYWTPGAHAGTFRYFCLMARQEH